MIIFLVENALCASLLSTRGENLIFADAFQETLLDASVVHYILVFRRADEMV